MTSYDEAVAGWAAALRGGDSRTWADWLSQPGTAPAGFELPHGSGAHLEVVRRLLLAGPPISGFEGLADLVLATPAIGRGRVDLPLPWSGSGPVRLGTPPLAPEQIPDVELLRVAIGVVSRLLIEHPVGAEPTQPERSGRRWARRFRVHGAPAGVAAVRRSLLAAGLAEGDFRTTHLVISAPIEQLMNQHWAARVEHGGTLSWRRLWRYVEARDTLPNRLDAARLAGKLGQVVPIDRVHVLVAGSPAAAVAQAAALLKVSVPERPVAAAPSAVQLDLRRRVNAVLVQAVGEAGRDALAPQLDQWSPIVAATPLGVPAPQREWAERAAGQLAERLGTGGYPVHGDPRQVAALLGPGVPHDVDRAATLELALVAIRRAWEPAGSGAEEDS